MKHPPLSAAGFFVGSDTSIIQYSSAVPVQVYMHVGERAVCFLLLVFADGLIIPSRTVVLFWGQTSLILTILSPKRDCGPKRVNLNSSHTWYNTDSTVPLPSPAGEVEWNAVKKHTAEQKRNARIPLECNITATPSPRVQKKINNNLPGVLHLFFNHRYLLFNPPWGWTRTNSRMFVPSGNGSLDCTDQNIL